MVCKSFKRAIQTAEALSKFVTNSKVVIENKLIEQNFGDWSGKKFLMFGKF